MLAAVRARVCADDPDGDRYIYREQLVELVTRLHQPLGSLQPGERLPPPLLASAPRGVNGLTDATRVHFRTALRELIQRSYSQVLQVDSPDTNLNDGSVTAREMRGEAVEEGARRAANTLLSDDGLEAEDRADDTLVEACGKRALQARSSELEAENRLLRKRLAALETFSGEQQQELEALNAAAKASTGAQAAAKARVAAKAAASKAAVSVPKLAGLATAGELRDLQSASSSGGAAINLQAASSSGAAAINLQAASSSGCAAIMVRGASMTARYAQLARGASTAHGASTASLDSGDSSALPDRQLIYPPATRATARYATTRQPTETGARAHEPTSARSCGRSVDQHGREPPPSPSARGPRKPVRVATPEDFIPQATARALSRRLELSPQQLSRPHTSLRKASRDGMQQLPSSVRLPAPVPHRRGASPGVNGDSRVDA